MITAFENFQVGAAGQRGLDADANFAGIQWRRRDVFNANEFLPMQDGGFHARRVADQTGKTKRSF
jgi:hypothetical protein